MISILLFPSLVAVLLAFGCFAFVRVGIQNPLLAAETSQAHLLKASLYIAVGTGLPLAVFSFAAGCVLAVASFVFKSWTRAGVAIGIAASGMYIWLFLLNIPYPL